MNHSTITNNHLITPSWEYHIVSERHTHPDMGVYRSYGIHVFEIAGVHIRPVATIHDITTKEDDAHTFVAMCNRYQLSPIHLQDFAQDFIQAHL